MHGAICVWQRDMRVLSRGWISETLSVLAFPLTFFLTFGLGLKGYITDVEGVRMNPDDPSSVISEFPASDFDRLVSEGVIKGGMIPKVEACVNVVRGGVEKAHIIDGRKHHAILLELLTTEGIGTMISRS